MLDYLWIVIAGGITSFTAAMGIGANDVANAFASSIGSRALTVKSAVIIASIFECAGAVLMGSHVTKTIRKGIADYECFEESPDIFIYGCFSVLISVTLWLFLASYFEMPVSTTHSCVGGMIGMTMLAGGSDCVIWYKETDSFPYIGGVSGIVLSWFLSPIFSAIVAGSLFFITRLSVLRRENSFDKAYVLFPILVGLTLLLNSFFIIYKGGKGIGLDDISEGVALLISLGIGIVSGLVIVPFIPTLKNKVEQRFSENNSPERQCILNNEIVITDDMSNYTISEEDSFLEMQCEEILDGIIYTVSSYLRWISKQYGIEFESGIDNNPQIKDVIKVGIAFNDDISLKYKEILDGMILTYKRTKDLQRLVVY